MVQEGIMERFEINEVYAIHNVPGQPIGAFATTAGPIMAAVDTFTINIKGKGGHGAMPQETVDPIVAGCGMVDAIQTIVSRNNHMADDLVVSVTQFHAGTVSNVIPETAYLNGTIRSFAPEVREMVKQRFHEIVAGQAASYGVDAELIYEEGYPATVNSPEQTAFAASVARQVVGDEAVSEEMQRVAGAEDFSYMLEERPGAYLMLGAGEGAALHHPEYNFNDEIAPIGASFFARLVEAAQPLRA